MTGCVWRLGWGCVSILLTSCRYSGSYWPFPIKSKFKVLESGVKEGGGGL